ncbi:MAG: YwaF family protein [Clostridia bacterium]|nr:YwaF family protein [Clostridia bacterium]
MNFAAYKFFDYKYNIENFSSDLFSTPHIIFIILSFLLVPTISILLRKANHKKIDKFLKVFSICIAVFEIVKIVWESYYDITTGRGFNIGGILPLYTCSLFIYCLLISAWCKNEKIRNSTLSFLTTISLLAGAIGIVQCNGLNWYPFWTFGAFYSMIFHLSMFGIGTFLLISGYKKLNWIDMIYAWIPMVILSLFATPVNYEHGADYMQIYEGSGVPVFSTLAQVLAANKLRFIYTFIMLLTYIPFAGIVVCISKLVYLINSKITEKHKSKLNK